MTAVTEDTREATYLFHWLSVGSGVVRSPSTALSPSTKFCSGLLA